jgi:hypothetical protein
MLLPPGCEGLRVRRMTVWWTFRRPCMGRPVPRQFMRNALLDVTTIMSATAYYRRSYAERYRRSTYVQLSTCETPSFGHPSCLHSWPCPEGPAPV